jgi:hypothetical protein
MKLPMPAWKIVRYVVRGIVGLGTLCIVPPMITAAWTSFLDPAASPLGDWHAAGTATAVFATVAALAGLAFGFAQVLNPKPVRPCRPTVVRAGASLSLGAVWFLLAVLEKLTLAPHGFAWRESGVLTWVWLVLVYLMVLPPAFGALYFTVFGLIRLQLGLLAVLWPVKPDSFFLIPPSQSAVAPAKK